MCAPCCVLAVALHTTLCLKRLGPPASSLAGLWRSLAFTGSLVVVVAVGVFYCVVLQVRYSAGPVGDLQHSRRTHPALHRLVQTLVQCWRRLMKTTRFGPHARD